MKRKQQTDNSKQSKQNWQNKHVTVLGLGKSGYASALYLNRRGAHVLVSESGQLKGDNAVWAEKLLHLGVDIEVGEHSIKAIEQADLIITSPGIPPGSDVIKRAYAANVEVICDIELAYRESSIPIIAVTGTNGKSTTTALISHILQFNGFNAPACGNIGTAVMEFIPVDAEVAADKRATGNERITADKSPTLNGIVGVDCIDPRIPQNTGACNAPLRIQRSAIDSAGQNLAGIPPACDVPLRTGVDSTGQNAPTDSPAYLIMEVSSYQLYYTKHFAPHIAIWLNLTPDHLDWHEGMAEYIAAKEKIFINQNKDAFAVLNLDDAIVSTRKIKSQLFPFSVKQADTRRVAANATDESNDQTPDGIVRAHRMRPHPHESKAPEEIVGVDRHQHIDPAAFILDDWLSYRLNGKTERVCQISQAPIIGRHNLENILAAIAATAITGLSAKQIGEAIKQFKALEHRLEYVDTIDGVPCYNDSKATNPESSIKALQAFAEKIVLIAGGRDKGTNLTEFTDNVRNHAAAVILLGEAKERFEKAFNEAGVKNIYMVNSLTEAVELGLKLKLGPVVLSPACASYDMFKNFEERGNVFKDIVHTKCAQVRQPL